MSASINSMCVGLARLKRAFLNAWRTLLKFGIFHPSTNNDATGILTQLPEQRTGATAANIVSPPEASRGRTALDIISFAVENKSIEKASFQSSV